MAEATRRLALACRLRRPFTNREEDEKEMEEKAEQREAEVAERRRAVGEDMASLLAVMSEVSASDGVRVVRSVIVQSRGAERPHDCNPADVG